MCFPSAGEDTIYTIYRTPPAIIQEMHESDSYFPTQFFNGDGTDSTTRFKITNEDRGKETCLSFSALTADHKPVTNGYLMPASVSDGPKQVERPLVVGSAGPNYNTEVYLVGNYTYDTLPVDRSN